MGFHTLLTSRWLKDFWHKVIFKTLLSPLSCLHCSDLCSALHLVLMPPLLLSRVLFAFFPCLFLRCILVIWEIKTEDIIIISPSFLVFLELPLLLLFVYCVKAFLTFTAFTYILVLFWTEQYWACSPPDYNTICCFCDTFITSHFLFSSLSLCRPSPPSVYPYPLCPFLMLSFSFIPSLITPPFPPLFRPVWPSSGLQLFQPLLLHVLFQGLKPSQTISSGVFCTKGQRKWGEVCRLCVMWWNSGGLRVPFSSNANMLIEFLSYFLAFVFRFTSPLPGLCLAPTGKWGIHLGRDILPIVSLSLENIWTPV